MEKFQVKNLKDSNVLTIYILNVISISISYILSIYVIKFQYSVFKIPLLIYNGEAFYLFQITLSSLNKETVSFIFQSYLPNINKYTIFTRIMENFIKKNT